MSDLYTIDSMLARLLDIGGTIIDEETGEVVPFDEVLALQMARADKIEGWGLWLKNRKAEAEAIDAEIKNLKTRLDALNRQRERSQEEFQRYLGGEKFRTARLVVSYRKSSSVVFEGDPESLPDEYKTIKTEIKPNKEAMKPALQRGEQIEGARLVTKQNIQIK